LIIEYKFYKISYLPCNSFATAIHDSLTINELLLLTGILWFHKHGLSWTALIKISSQTDQILSSLFRLIFWFVPVSLSFSLLHTSLLHWEGGLLTIIKFRVTLWGILVICCIYNHIVHILWNALLNIIKHITMLCTY